VKVDVPRKDRKKADSEPDQTQRKRGVKGGRAAEWQRLLIEGVYKSKADLARAMGVSRAAVTQALAKANVGGSGRT